MKKMLLIDGNSLVFRAYHATLYGNLMRTSNGIPVNAVFGFASMVQKALELLKPDAVLVAFDTGKKTFRHEMYKEYKGTRKQLDEDLIVQFPIVREYLDAMNIARYEKDGIEADDVIGIMAKMYPDWQTDILSSDKDLLQLIDNTTSVWLIKKGMSELVEVDSEKLYEMYQLKPEQIIDLKGLMGDASDNIPGIPGVGEKTAIKLLTDYQTMENIYNHTDELKGKLQERVIENRELAYLSKKLATITTDYDIDVDVDSLTFVPEASSQYEFFTKYEMKTFLRNIDVSEPVEKKELSFETVTNVDINWLENPTVLSPLVHDKSIKGFVLKNNVVCCYISTLDAKNDQVFIDWLADNKLVKIVYDIKAVFHLLDNDFSCNINNVYDLMISSFLIKSNLSGWKSFVEYYQGKLQPGFDDAYGSCKKPSENCLYYACEVSHFLYSIYPDNVAKLKEDGLDKLYYDLEYPLAKVLFEMEKTGIRVDIEVLDRIANETAAILQSLTEKIYDGANEEFNINSPKKLSEVLYDRLGLPGGKKRSTAIDVLEKLEGVHPIISHIMQYRKYQKLYSTYAEGLKKYVHSDNRIHTKYNQCVTQTGRLSSTDPNLQNISVRTEEGREIRKAFVPDENSVLMSADYSQIELRVLADMADEKELIDAFCNEMDIHTKTAMNVFGVKEDGVTSLMRRKAKAVNFGIVYGISDFGLAQQLQISREEAKDYIDKYLQTYPRIKVYMDEIIKYCEDHGYVKTLLNRRREIPEINDKNYMTREFGKRAAMNAPIQGTAADLIKIAMINIHEKMAKRGLESKMILQVHDELVFNVVNSEYEVMKELVEKEMAAAMELKVPLVANCVTGSSWYEAK